MEIQQAIIVVMLTAVICIFIGMISQSLYPDGVELGAGHGAKMSRIMVFGFVLIPWVLVVTITDLYMENARLKQDMTEYMGKC
jgi:hypothetical protein